MNKYIPLSILSSLLLQTHLLADTHDIAKRSLKGNMNIVYNKLPGTASNIGEMLSSGEYYG